MGRLRIALCQVDATVGDLEGNATLVRGALQSAEHARADLAVFPELVMSGYPPEDLLLEESFVAANEESVKALARETGRCVAVVGSIEARAGVLFNAAVVMGEGRVLGVVEKQILPNYGVFDERRYFEPGEASSPLFDIAGVRVGVVICEDAWSSTGPIGRLVSCGAQLIISINASPFRQGVIDERIDICRARLAETGVPIAYVNLVGGQDELVFDGASMLVDSSGKAHIAGPQFAEGVVVIDVEVESSMAPPAAFDQALKPKRPRGESERQVAETSIALLSPVEEVYRALVLATADYVRKNRFTDVVIGLSGGIDSALVAVVATDALGAEHVHGIAMPSRFSSASSLDDAALVATGLSIDFREIQIEPVHASLLGLLEPSFEGTEPDITEENLQARTRGTILMALSNKFGWLVLTTGNKSEMAVGYSTLYGDMAGGFAVIRDVPKTLVYELCAMRNRCEGVDLVPKTIMEKPPTAELRFDQRDDDTLPPYEILDPILEGYVEKGQSVADLVLSGHDEAVVRRVIDLVDRAEYKRRQAAPGVRVTSRGFGKDRRMPITNSFRASRLPTESTR